MSGILIAVVIGVVGFVIIGKMAGSAHTVIRLGDGTVTVVKGTLPPGLKGDLESIARSASGTIELRGGGSTLLVKSEGLSAGDKQRVLNVVMLVRNRIRP